MKLVLALLASVVAISPLAVHAQFEGTLALEPLGCAQAGKCILKNKLRFTDSKSLVWEAAAGLETDGASIPPFFQPLVGKPFEESFLKAAIVHDHYCKRHVRPWRLTHRIFYEGLIDQDVPKGKAKLMYYAVYLGGPKWVELVPGNKCGQNCINKITTLDGKPTVNFREADYSLFDMKAELEPLKKELQANPDALSLEQLEARAKLKRPGDYYYRNGDKVQMNDDMITE